MLYIIYNIRKLLLCVSCFDRFSQTSGVTLLINSFSLIRSLYSFHENESCYSMSFDCRGYFGFMSSSSSFHCIAEPEPSYVQNSEELCCTLWRGEFVDLITIITLTLLHFCGCYFFDIIIYYYLLLFIITILFRHFVG